MMSAVDCWIKAQSAKETALGSGTHVPVSRWAKSWMGVEGLYGRDSPLNSVGRQLQPLSSIQPGPLHGEGGPTNHNVLGKTKRLTNRMEGSTISGLPKGGGNLLSKGATGGHGFHSSHRLGLFGGEDVEGEGGVSSTGMVRALGRVVDTGESRPVLGLTREQLV